MPKSKKPHVVEAAPPELARPDWIVVALALAGLAVAGYLTALKLGGTQAFLCRDGSGCDLVQASRYSELAGVPTAMWGAGIYLAIAVLAALPRTARRWQAAFMLASGAVAFSLYLTYISLFVVGATCPYCLALAIAVLAAMPRTARRWQAAFMLASGAVAFSLYLTYISIFVIGATCPYCLASGGIAVALLVAMLWRRPAAQGRPAAAFKPGRLAGLGITAGVFTVLLGAFIFAADFSVPAGYQSALARHMAKSQVIFYGAFW